MRAMGYEGVDCSSIRRVHRIVVKNIYKVVLLDLEILRLQASDFNFDFKE